MNTGNKRKDAMEDDSKPKRIKKECDYGEKCYRRNPAHFREFSHKHLESILDAHTGSGTYPIPDKYKFERQLIIEQLDTIVEKQLYTPANKVENQGEGSTSSSTTNNHSTTKPQNKSPATQISVENLEDHRKSPNTLDRQRSSQKLQEGERRSPLNSQRSSQKLQEEKRMPLKAQEGARRSPNLQESVKVVRETSPMANSSNSMEAKKKDSEYRPIVPPTRRVEDYLNVVVCKGKMLSKHAESAPYHIFYTTITAARDTHNQPYSITFQEILDCSLGELKCSLQINFMVEIGWLLAQYYFAGYSEKKLTILYGDECSDLKDISKKKPQVDAHRIQMPTPFGTHHTKMMILCYEDGSLRVVISTANLYIDDWENRTQGLWFSPRCPELPPDAMPHDGDSPTMFKRSLLRYLNNYHLPPLAAYVERVRRCDFSHINVFLVASTPGSHFDMEWGMTRMGTLLRQHCAIPAAETRKWPLLAQASSLGSFGNKPNVWLTGDFLHHFTKVKEQPQTLTTPPELKLIYPSLENVHQSHDGLLGGGCLPYAASAHTKQPWLKEYLYQWRARSTRRDRAMPHIKCYTRISPDNKMAAYFLLTSANVSKAAWGSINKGNAALRIMSYEAGVLFIPKYVINEDLFPIEESSKNRLILPYDVPPTKYSKDMSPWVSDYLCR